MLVGTISIIVGYWFTFPLVHRAVVLSMGNPIEGTVLSVSDLQSGKTPWVGKFRTILAKAAVKEGALQFGLIIGSEAEALPRVGHPIGMHVLTTQKCWISNERTTMATLGYVFLVALNGYSAKCTTSGLGAFAVSDQAFGLPKQCLLFLLMAAIIYAGIAFFQYQALRKEKSVLETGVPVRGSVESSQWSSLRTNSVVVTYQWQNEPKKKRFPHASKTLRKGQRVTVLVNQANPRLAVLYPSSRFHVTK